MATRRTATPEEISTIITLKSKGMPFQKIARAVHMSDRIVRSVLNGNLPQAAQTGKNPGWVYIMANPLYDCVKIGRTINITNREKSYRTGSPVAIEFIAFHTNDCVKLEKLIHNDLKHLHVNEGGGTEFFNISVRHAKYVIEGIQKEYNL